jgi:hypothetical protein
MSPEVREHILAAAESLSRARDIQQRAWIDAGRPGNHEDAVWWHINSVVLELFILAVREP